MNFLINSLPTSSGFGFVDDLEATRRLASYLIPWLVVVANSIWSRMAEVKERNPRSFSPVAIQAPPWATRRCTLPKLVVDLFWCPRGSKAGFDRTAAGHLIFEIFRPPGKLLVISRDIG